MANIAAKYHLVGIQVHKKIMLYPHPCYSLDLEP